MIADLRTTVPGVLLAVEVTLPRTIDSETGRPRRVVVRQRPLRPSDEGDIRLVLDDLPRRLQARARVLRVADSSRGDAPRAIDTRGSYVSRIGLAAPGDYRPRELWTKRLSIENLVRPPNLPTTATQPGDSGPLLMSAKSRDRSVAGGSIVPTRVTVDSEGFRIDGRGFIPRAWRWRGESLELLAERGFNTVWFDQPLDRATLEEASLRRLHLLAPPPSDPTSLRDVSLAPVLAWVIPGVSTERNVDTRLVAIEKCRALPADQRRPILVETNAPKKWARIADGLLIDTTTSRLSASDRLEDLLRSAADRSPPGTLLISIIRADLGTPAQKQIDALLDGAIVPAWLPPMPIAHAVHATLATGCRGFVFAATEPLDSPDDPTLAAADWLQATNRRLGLIEPWIAGPRPRGTVGSDALLLERNRIRLATPRPFPIEDRPPLVLAGVSDGAPLHRITPAGVSSVAAERIAGGLRIGVADYAAPGAILFGHDARIVQSLRRYTARRGQKAAIEITRLASSSLKLNNAIDPNIVAEVKRRISQANLALARSDHAEAYDLAHAALETIETATEQRRRLAIGTGHTMESSPLAVLPATLTDHFSLMSLLPSAERGPNRLAGGSFEDIDTVRRHGWRHDSASEASGVAVELAEGSSIHGERRLRMNSDHAESPSILSPRIELAEGELIEITGWARVESPSGGRLKIIDTLGGEELSLVLGATDRWTPFRLLRRAPHATGVALRFTLSGIATAEIDGVMLRSIQAPGNRLETATRSDWNGATQPK